MNKPLNDLTEQLMTEERTLKITALCKKAVIVIVDFILYFIANTAIVYLTMGGACPLNGIQLHSVQLLASFYNAHAALHNQQAA